MSADLYAHPALTALELDALMVATQTDPERTKAGNFKLVQARERFGKKFAHEPGSDWQPRKAPVLTEWMQTKGSAA